MALVLLGLTVALGAAPTQAAPVAATCATLQSKLTAAQDGDVITLDSSDGPGGLCAQHYSLPNFPAPVGIENYKTVSLTGDPSNGQDGFDGTGLAAPGTILTGSNIDRFEISQMLFRDGSSTGNGGAIAVDGRSSLAVRNSTFLHNHAGGNGGAVYFTQAFPVGDHGLQASLNVSDSQFGSATASDGNTADGNGGAVAVVAPGVGANGGIVGSTFTKNIAGQNGGGFDWVINGGDNISLNNNTLGSNKAGGSGGGAHVKVADLSIFQISSERYEANSVEGTAAAGDHFGGGLFIENGGSNIFQRNSVFTGNSVKTFTNGEDYGGGGEAIVNTKPPAQPNDPTTQSELDQFRGNTVAGQANGSGHESEGGGLYVAGDNSVFNGRLTLVAANSVGANGDGGGAYAGGAVAGTLLEFHDSTVAGNSVGTGGAGTGLAGNGNDRLKLRNSIVWNVPKPDIDGFANTDIAFSDACQGATGTSVPAGLGNICADPLLANAAAGDIHQTLASPTVDKGSDQEYFDDAGEGPFTDFEGDPRPTDGDGDGHTSDMGADEGPAFVRPVVPGVVTTSAAPAQCANGKDDDSDGATDLQDPGCSSKADNNEGDETLNQLVLCGRRTISLVRADARGSKVVLSGLVASTLAGRKVTIYADHAGAKAGRLAPLGSVKADKLGRFTATVPRPPAKLFTKARYQARVGSAKSVSLKLPQSLATASVKKAGSQIVVTGTVKRSLLGKRNAVVIRRIVCGHYKTVGSAKPAASGRYTVRFTAPANSDAALFRAEGKVLARPGAKKYVKQFARAVGITLTGQTG